MRFGAVFAIAAIAALLSWPALAANDPAAGTEAAAPREQTLSQGELDALVAPIALYPDALLAQVLMASTYPLEVVQADRFAKANKSLKGDKLDEALKAGLGREREGARGDADRARHDERRSRLDAEAWRRGVGAAGGHDGRDPAAAGQSAKRTASSNDQRAEGHGDQGSRHRGHRHRAHVPETVYVPYYEPAVVYGTWDYPDYPPYYFAPAPGWVVGGAIATGIAWGAASPSATPSGTASIGTTATSTSTSTRT